MRELPSEGKIYRHFKGTYYRVICIARDSETLAEMVVYENRDDASKKYVRPLSEFMSETDREKYPDAGQRYRFEEESPAAESGGESGENEEEAPPDLMAFLDAEDMEEKLDVLERIKGRLNDDIISAIALSLDTEVREGSIQDKYEEIKDYLLTTIKYEGARLRNR
ncbi:MAG: DUF1653 domain-containing protein [Lachnospiraceae bacterium]|nr:DUF1653 domain-containing protein [Lachnospiraceae bacterium]